MNLTSFQFLHSFFDFEPTLFFLLTLRVPKIIGVVLLNKSDEESSAFFAGRDKQQLYATFPLDFTNQMSNR